MTLPAVFIASLLGSMHCVGMCGGFVAVARNAGGGALRAHVLYHAGRLLTYTTLGAISGYLGARLDDNVALLGLQHLSVYLTAGLLIVFGVSSFFSGGYQAKHSGVVQKFATAFNVLLAFGQRHGVSRAFMLGACSTLLPCGWLYGFVAVAAISGGLLGGAATMFVFWLGTLPALSFLAEFIAKLVARFGLSASRAVSVLLIVAGVWALLSHALHLGTVQHQSCHSSQSESH